MVPLVLMLLSQPAFVTWTDGDGVVHAGLQQEAPAGARPVEAPLSVISDDARPAVLADGGTRHDDTRWWQARLGVVRDEVARHRALELATEDELRRAKTTTCATATATAELPAETRWVQRSPRQRPVAVQLEPVRHTVTQTTCTEQAPPEALRVALAAHRTAREAAERRLRALEADALAAGLPWSKLR